MKNVKEILNMNNEDRNLNHSANSDEFEIRKFDDNGNKIYSKEVINEEA